MIGYVSVEEQVDKDFHRALLKTSLHRLRERLRKDSAHERFSARRSSVRPRRLRFVLTSHSHKTVAWSSQPTA